MSATKTCATKMKDIQLIKRVLEEKMGWKKIEMMTDVKQPLSASMWDKEIKNAELVVKKENIPNGRYADFAVIRGDDGFFQLAFDPHGLESVPQYAPYVNSNREKGADEFKIMIEGEYAKKEFENDAISLGAEIQEGWNNQGEMVISIDEDLIDSLPEAVSV